MPILIDGWNLIRNKRSKINDDGEDSLEALQQLILYLNDFQRTHNDPITLVMDSTREHLGIEYRNHPKLSIVAARNADAYIKKHIDKVPERQRRNLRVVSSDSDVYFYAKSAYATPIKSEEFWSKL